MTRRWQEAKQWRSKGESKRCRRVDFSPCWGSSQAFRKKVWSATSLLRENIIIFAGLPRLNGKALEVTWKAHAPPENNSKPCATHHLGSMGDYSNGASHKCNDEFTVKGTLQCFGDNACGTSHGSCRNRKQKHWTHLKNDPEDTQQTSKWPGNKHQKEDPDDCEERITSHGEGCLRSYR